MQVRIFLPESCSKINSKSSAIFIRTSFYVQFVSVKNHYWYQMYLDDLPIWGIVGEMEDKEFYIWTHKKFEIGYNGNQIIDVNLTSEGKTKLKLGEELAFSYEVTWKRSSLKFEVRKLDLTRQSE